MQSYQLNDPFQMLEPAFFQHPRIHVVFEMSIVEWQSQAVQTFGSEEFGIGVGEEVLEELVEEVVILLLSKNFEHCCTMLAFVPGIACDELQCPTFSTCVRSSRAESESSRLTFSMFIQPPNPAPRSTTALPSLPTTLSPSTLRMPVDMLVREIDRGSSLAKPDHWRQATLMHLCRYNSLN